MSTFLCRVLLLFVFCVLWFALCVVVADTNMFDEAAKARNATEKALGDLRRTERLASNIEVGAGDMVSFLQKGQAAADEAKSMHTNATAELSKYPSVRIKEAQRSAKSVGSLLKEAEGMASYLEKAMKETAPKEWAATDGQAREVAEITEEARKKAYNLADAYELAERATKAKKLSSSAVDAMNSAVSKINDAKGSFASSQNPQRAQNAEFQKLKKAVSDALKKAKEAHAAAEKAQQVPLGREFNDLTDKVYWLEHYSSDALKKLEEGKSKLEESENISADELEKVLKDAVEAGNNATSESASIVGATKDVVVTSANDLSPSIEKALNKAKEVRDAILAALGAKKAALKKAADDAVAAEKKIGRRNEFMDIDVSVFMPLYFATLFPFYICFVVALNVFLNF